MEKKLITAIYPGSFDPITLGHLDILKRASTLFDKVIIAIAINSEKKPLFSKKTRLKMIKDVTSNIPNIEVDNFTGLLVDYAKNKNAEVIIRGIRALSDYEYEFNMALINRSLEESITTTFLVAHQNYTHLSSSLVREVAGLGGDVSNLVPKNVIEELKRKLDAND
ncbi:MAG: pantetheine-phosphate adenylyltransferase [Candidatus Marinimicrobia bacterium]|nr:pantetheine-phosphate adenylyltransferase [Candidatus Neomarinimicrobiota bacterium]